MAEEKTYSIPGTVTIGADEYRDIIATVITIKAELKALEESHKAEVEALKASHKAEIAKINETNEANMAVLKDENLKYWERGFSANEKCAELTKEAKILNRYKEFVTTDEARHTAFKEWEESNG